MKKASVIFSVLICIVLMTSLFISCSEPAPTTTINTTTTATTTPSQTTPTTTATIPTTTASQTTPATTATKTPKAGGILRFISNEQPSALGVPEIIKTQGYQYVNPIIETLVRRDKVNDEIIFTGVLAESWSWAPDYQSITFKLRQGVKFHDGTDFNAEAVKWNIQLSKDAGMSRAADVESVDVIDEHTVRFNLVEYTSLFLMNLEDGNGFGFMISPTAYEENGRDWAMWNPVGTGPFKFKNWEQDVTLEMERFDDYWGGKPLLDGVKWLFIQDTLTAQMAFENGDAERLYLITKGEELAEFYGPKGYNVIFNDSGLQDLVVPSSKVEGSPWAKLEVRMAFDYALDREGICEAIGRGFWEPTYSMHIYSEPPDFQPRMYDPEKAKELLENAGYAEGFTTTLWQGTNFAGPATLILQENLKDVGIELEIQPITPPKWIELDQGPVGWGDGLLWSGAGAAGVNDWSTFTNYMYINLYSGGGRWNVTMDRPDDIEAMCQAFLQITDEAEALPAARAIDAAAYDDAMIFPLWVKRDCVILSPKVMDYSKWLTPYWNFVGCWIDN